MSVDHYENFPVASVLCPAHIRPAVIAIYHFARTADDLADEGDATPQQRCQDLRRYQDDLLAVFEGGTTSGTWPAVFSALDRARVAFNLPLQPFEDLLDAFIQDTGNPRYRNRAELLDYCRRSANPVGRLLLHLYGVSDAPSLEQSDAICSALQLINFWQDLSVDLPRSRVYLPMDDAHRFGIDLARPAELSDDEATRKLVVQLCSWAEQLMHAGAPLTWRIPGRAGWELRLVVQGGLRILEKIHAMHGSTIRQRPRLTGLDLPCLLWRALRMKAKHQHRQSGTTA